jgi:putative tryptophan/tyrosine transport system substrate-binding protein
MRRRFIASLSGAAMLGATLPAFAQTQRVMRIGSLNPLPATHPDQIEIGKQWDEGMKRLGWEVGRNLSADYRYGGFDPDLQFAHAKALVESKVDVILAVGEIPLQAAFRATKTVPIVFIAVFRDPVEAGYAKSFSRPGGNVTGVTGTSGEEYYKAVELMLAIRPGLKLGFSSSNSTPGVGVGGGFAPVQAAARRLGLQLVQLPDVRDMAGIEPMLAAAKKEGIQGLMFGAQVFLKGEGFRRIQAWATENGVLTQAHSYFRGDVLIAHGSNWPAQLVVHYRQLDQVLRGGNPAEIPIEQPTVYDVIISRKIAKAMGLTLPTSVLLQATEVID